MKLFKFLIFFRERFLIYRLFKIIKYYAGNNDFSFSIALKYVIANPVRVKSISIEKYFYRYRGYSSHLPAYLQELPFVWQDVYGIGMRIEHVLDNDININIEYLKVWANLLYCFVENRLCYTNNHFLMNALILKRLSLHVSLPFDSELDSLIDQGFKYVFKSNFFLERSSNYLFLIGHRLVLADYRNFVKNENEIIDKIIVYYRETLKYAERTTWIGDISPDIFDSTKVDSSKLYNKSDVICDILNFGSFIFVYAPNYILKISLDNKIERHGHEDYGSVVLCSDTVNIYDVGIEDLAYKEYKEAACHNSFGIGDFIEIIRDKQKVIHFSNCSIFVEEDKVVFEYKVRPRLKFLTNSLLADTGNYEILNSEVAVFLLNSAISAKLVEYKTEGTVVDIYNG
ncbi:hypothetical protein N8991_03510 [Schleiferiaceae bacterium]|nr:hypothetical protein [Schleiferiaceae bacterium]